MVGLSILGATEQYFTGCLQSMCSVYVPHASQKDLLLPLMYCCEEAGLSMESSDSFHCCIHGSWPAVQWCCCSWYTMQLFIHGIPRPGAPGILLSTFVYLKTPSRHLVRGHAFVPQHTYQTPCQVPPQLLARLYYKETNSWCTNTIPDCPGMGLVLYQPPPPP